MGTGSSGGLSSAELPRFKVEASRQETPFLIRSYSGLKLAEPVNSSGRIGDSIVAGLLPLSPVEARIRKRVG